MITIGLTKIILVGLYSLVVLVVYSFIKSAKRVKDYERIKDYIIIGTLMWLLGTYRFDSSLGSGGMCIFDYGLAYCSTTITKKDTKRGLGEREMNVIKRVIKA